MHTMFKYNQSKYRHSPNTGTHLNINIVLIYIVYLQLQSTDRLVYTLYIQAMSKYGHRLIRERLTQSKYRSSLIQTDYKQAQSK